MLERTYSFLISTLLSRQIKSHYQSLHEFSFSSFLRNSSSRLDKSDWNTVLCSNGVVAIWHPEKPFPFEHTNPINLDNEAKERQKFFKRCANPNDFPPTRPYGQSGPKNVDLREIFYTDPQEWRSRNREKRLHHCIAPVEQRRK